MGESSLKPKYRYSLRAKIHEAGYRTLTEFSKHVGVDTGRISRICSGWEIPSPGLCEKMVSSLGVTVRELKALL